MKVAAPGKLLLTGAYAVLAGAPAIVMAVDRLAIADDAVVDSDPPASVRAALSGAPAPRVDVRALHQDAIKLGLGSSAAALVAALGVRAAAHGHDLASEDTRARLLLLARSAHAAAQRGGSGVDVAASIYGGVLRYQLVDGEPDVQRVRLPENVHVRALWSGKAARTNELRARVDAFRAREPREWRARFAALAVASHDAARALDENDPRAFVGASIAFAGAMCELGGRDELALVPAAWSLLTCAARTEQSSAFFPSGAGGGDCAVWIGPHPPSESWLARAKEIGFVPLTLATDDAGVRVLAP